MKNKEIRDALASAFLDAGLTVRVVTARSTDSLYVTASNDRTMYTVRIAHHQNSRRFHDVSDYWIDTTKQKLVVEAINWALQRAGERLGVIVPMFDPPVVSEVCPQIEDKPPQVEDSVEEEQRENLIDLANYYAYEGYWVPEMTCEIQQPVDYELEAVNNVLEDVLGESEDGGSERALGWAILFFVLGILVFYCLR